MPIDGAVREAPGSPLDNRRKPLIDSPGEQKSRIVDARRPARAFAGIGPVDRRGGGEVVVRIFLGVTQHKTAVLCTVGIMTAAGILLGAPGVRAETLPPGPTIEGMSRECIAEPVFGGTVCVYEGNRNAGRTVILVHGINGRAMDWVHQIPELLVDRHVIAIDLPGFGASSKANVLYSIESYSAVLDFVIARYAQDRVSLVGHSLGGAIVLWYAGHHSDRVDRIVLADVPGILHRLTLAKHSGGDWFDRLVGQAATPAPSAVGRLIGEMLERFEWLPMDAEPVLQSESARERLLGGQPARIAGLALAYTNFSAVIGTAVAPALVVWGEADAVATSRTGYVLAARLPHGRLALLPGGHVPMKEQPGRFTELILAHLDDVGVRHAPALGARGPANGRRVARCEHESSVVFSGHYDELAIYDCADVTIRDATIGHLDVVESTVVLLNAVIRSQGVAATITGSEVIATATDVTGEVAIHASGSRLDLAGVRLTGTTAAIVADRGSHVTFSVSWVESPHKHGPVHEFLEITPGRPL